MYEEFKTIIEEYIEAKTTLITKSITKMKHFIKKSARKYLENQIKIK